jgi:hypothetical protein
VICPSTTFHLMASPSCSRGWDLSHAPVGVKGGERGYRGSAAVWLTFNPIQTNRQRLFALPILGMRRDDRERGRYRIAVPI